jgi:hypothetical protein
MLTPIPLDWLKKFSFKKAESNFILKIPYLLLLFVQFKKLKMSLLFIFRVIHFKEENSFNFKHIIMKKNYTLKLVFVAILVSIFSLHLTAQENVRILRADPSTNSITLKNFGDATATISGYWFCVRPAYAQLSSMTAQTTLAPGAELDVASSLNLVVASGEFALYNSSSFGSSAAMLDFLQWGTGAAISRESVAVAAGLWVADTFITDAPPFQYNGDGTQNGVSNWSTLSVDSFRENNGLKMYPNPTSDILNIEINSSITNGQIEVFDLLGKQVYVQSIASNDASQIDVSKWESGLYLVKITSENGNEIKRFIKQ